MFRYTLALPRIPAIDIKGFKVTWWPWKVTVVWIASILLHWFYAVVTRGTLPFFVAFTNAVAFVALSSWTFVLCGSAIVAMIATFFCSFSFSLYVPVVGPLVRWCGRQAFGKLSDLVRFDSQTPSSKDAAPIGSDRGIDEASMLAAVYTQPCTKVYSTSAHLFEGFGRTPGKCEEALVGSILKSLVGRKDADAGITQPPDALATLTQAELQRLQTTILGKAFKRLVAKLQAVQVPDEARSVHLVVFRISDSLLHKGYSYNGIKVKDQLELLRLYHCLKGRTVKTMYVA